MSNFAANGALPSTAPGAYHFVSAGPSTPFPGFVSFTGNGNGSINGNGSGNGNGNGNGTAVVQPPIFAEPILSKILSHCNHATLLALRAVSTHLRDATVPFLDTHMVIRETTAVGPDGVIHVFNAPAIPFLEFLQEMYYMRTINGNRIKVPTMMLNERVLFNDKAARAKILEIATSAPMAAGLVGWHNEFRVLKTLHLRADKNALIPFVRIPDNVLRPETLVISVDERGYEGLASEAFIGWYDPIVLNSVTRLVLNITADSPVRDDFEIDPELLEEEYEPTEVDGSETERDSVSECEAMEVDETPQETAFRLEVMAELEAAAANPVRPPTLHVMSPNRGVDFRAPVLVNLTSIRVNVGPGVSHLQVAQLVAPYLVRDHESTIEVTFAGVGMIHQSGSTSTAPVYINSTVRRIFLDMLRMMAWAARRAVKPRLCLKKLRVELGLVELVPELPAHLYVK